jgi:hypothetical protein
MVFFMHSFILFLCIFSADDNPDTSRIDVSL